jgi:DNA-binding transcriptional ArsR family regulator
MIQDVQVIAALKAMANVRRLLILEWLKEPRRHFREQVDGDLVDDGVCGVLIAEKLGVSQPTVSEHMRILSQAGLVESKRIKQWIFYRRNEARLAAVKAAIASSV